MKILIFDGSIRSFFFCFGSNQSIPICCEEWTRNKNGNETYHIHCPSGLFSCCCWYAYAHTLCKCILVAGHTNPVTLYIYPPVSSFLFPFVPVYRLSTTTPQYIWLFPVFSLSLTQKLAIFPNKKLFTHTRHLFVVFYFHLYCSGHTHIAHYINEKKMTTHTLLTDHSFQLYFWRKKR